MNVSNPIGPGPLRLSNSDLRSRFAKLARALATTILLVADHSLASDFGLHDGDTVVFFGDSITEAGGYTQAIEIYTLMRYPERRIRFVNSGMGADTASAAVARLDTDVLSKKASVVFVVFGVNDIEWGAKADKEHKDRYLAGIRTIVERCRARGVRVIVCSPPITAEPPSPAEKGFLQSMADEGLALATSLGAETIDLSRGMRALQRQIIKESARPNDETQPSRFHAADGVHLSDPGQLAVAFVLLKALGAPDEVSAVTIDAERGVVTRVSGCAATLARGGGAPNRIEFSRLDDGLPLNLGILSSRFYRWVPVPDRLNRYMLGITGLPAGNYEIQANARSLGVVTAEQLAQGVNMASMTADGAAPGGPWDVQSGAVKELVEAEFRITRSDKFVRRYGTGEPDRAKVDKMVEAARGPVVALQRELAKPQPYRFVVQRVGD